jgi:hypothetical protein
VTDACALAVVPADVEYLDRESDAAVFVDGEWSCPHESLDGEYACPSHTPRERQPSDVEPADETLRLVAETESVEYGAFERLDVSFDFPWAMLRHTE